MKKSEAILGLLRIPLDALAVLAALLLSYRLRQESIDLIPRVQLLEPPLERQALRVVGLVPRVEPRLGEGEGRKEENGGCAEHAGLDGECPDGEE